MHYFFYVKEKEFGVFVSTCSCGARNVAAIYVKILKFKFICIG